MIAHNDAAYRKMEIMHMDMDMSLRLQLFNDSKFLTLPKRAVLYSSVLCYVNV